MNEHARIVALQDLLARLDQAYSDSDATLALSPGVSKYLNITRGQLRIQVNVLTRDHLDVLLEESAHACNDQKPA